MTDHDGSSPSPPLLQIDGLTRRYGDLIAVDDVDLTIRAGEIFALLGPNGAGKTTLIGCITGLVTGFEGAVRVAGRDVVRDYRVTRQLVGLVPQELNYDAFFTVHEVLRNQAGYFGVRPDSGRVEELLERFALADKADADTRWLSGGMKRRLMICKALVHDPVLLFLDEPTAGVDVELREDLWAYVRELRARGTTIVLTTHYIEEAEQLADRIGILHHGRLRRVAPRDELMAEFGQRDLTLELDRAPPQALLDALEGVPVERVGERALCMNYTEGDEVGPDRLLRAVFEHDLHVQSAEGGHSSLEEIFRQLIQAEQQGDDS